MPDREKVIDGLERLQFFNQRAGRELLADKPHDVQEKDIANADAVYDGALALLKEQKLVAVYESKISRCACGNTVNRYWHPKFCGYCGRELLWY